MSTQGHPLPEHHEDHPETISRVARRGLFLFMVYFAFFIGFILLSVFSPETMKNEKIALGTMEISLGGPNLAVVYGMGLIFAAFFLAMVYMRLTRQPVAK
jgi:hypothetical protein